MDRMIRHWSIISKWSRWWSDDWLSLEILMTQLSQNYSRWSRIIHHWSINMIGWWFFIPTNQLIINWGCVSPCFPHCKIHSDCGSTGLSLWLRTNAASTPLRQGDPYRTRISARVTRRLIVPTACQNVKWSKMVRCQLCLFVSLDWTFHRSRFYGLGLKRSISRHGVIGFASCLVVFLSLVIL